MASPNLYVRSTDGSDADNGTTWALAKATISGAAAIDSTTDNRIWVSQSHNESLGSAQTWTFAGTNGTPTWLVAANDGAAPPTAVSTATAATTSGNITVNGSVYIRGLTISSAAGIKLANNTADVQVLESCALHYTGSNSQFGPGATVNANTYVRLLNTDLKPLSTTSNWSVSGRVQIDGGSIVSGSSTNTGGLFTTVNSDRAHAELLISGFDFSNAGATFGLFAVQSGVASARFIARNCKLPTSWSGTFLSGTILPGQRFEMHNCDSADTNYRLLVKDYGGDITSETTIVRSSGASDGTTSLAWKMVTSANAKYPATGLQSPEIVQWSDTTGAKTVTVEIVHDSQGAGSGSKFQDDEIWLEVMSLNTSGFPLGTWTSDAKADVLATAANQADSSVTWTTTGLTTPVKQALSVSITTAEKGYIHARVVMAKASKTCYVDPVMTVT